MADEKTPRAWGQDTLERIEARDAAYTRVANAAADLFEKAAAALDELLSEVREEREAARQRATRRDDLGRSR